MLTYHIKQKALLTEVAAVCRALLEKRVGENPGPPQVPLQSLPFDHESNDEDIAAVMMDHIGSEIIWANSISGQERSAKLIQFRSVTRIFGGRDYMDVLTDEGFHSLYLRRIVSIG